MKKLVSLFCGFLLILMSLLAACGSSTPCVDCGDTPSKGYQNNSSGEKEYYCSYCASDCAFCSNRATKHYTSGFGTIIFVCGECYAEIKDLNS